jgi:putative FmdB family regulatory protein
MPIYDFHCRACGHDFEALVRTADTPECPACHGQDLERLLSGFAVSTAERRQAAAKKSRQRQIHAHRDKLIADEEARLHHDD